MKYMSLRKMLGACCVAVGTVIFGAADEAQASTVTLFDAEVDAIFSQASFGATPIDIRYSPIQTLVRPDLASIDSSTDWSNLINLTNSVPSVSAYYVSSINWCGTYQVDYIGCAQVGGHDFALEAGWAGSVFGPSLFGHELAHNFGLRHTTEGLLKPSISLSTGLTTSEVATMFDYGSRSWDSQQARIQGDAQSGYYIDVIPVRVVASQPASNTGTVTPVPLPTAGLFLLAAFGALGATRGSRRA